MSSPADNDDSVDSPTSPGGVANPVKKDLATLYQTYKQEHGLPENTDNCLFYIHFLLEQNTSENGVIWLWRDNEATSFQVLDKFAFAKRYGALSDANKAPKYDSIRRLLNNYDFHCVSGTRTILLTPRIRKLYGLATKLRQTESLYLDPATRPTCNKSERRPTEPRIWAKI